MMSKYQPHSGYFYVDIDDGSDPEKIDFCHIIPNEHKKGIMILKCDNEVAIYDFEELLKNKYLARVLNYKKFDNSDEAYSKMMKWIGKMIKKSVTSADTYHVSRYYNNKQDLIYKTPDFIWSKRMQHIYQYMLKVT